MLFLRKNLPNKNPSFFSRQSLNRAISSKQTGLILGGSCLLALAAIGLAYWSTIRIIPASRPLLPTVARPVLGLSLESPASGDVILDGLMTVKGKATPNATVIFYTESDENSVESDTQGNFEGTLSLEAGINTLTVVSFASNGEEESLTLDLVYDEDQVMGKKTSKTPPAQAKKEEKKPAKALIGGVEEVGEDSLTVTSKGNGRIKTRVDKDTKIIGQDKKILKLNALGSEDIAAVIVTDSGEVANRGQIKKAVKIYVKKAAQVKETKRRAVHGVIIGLSGNTITLAHQTKRDQTFVIITNEGMVIKIKGIIDATLADLEIGQRVAAVGTLNEEGGLVVKRIHLIPGKSTPSATATPIVVDAN